MAPAGRREPGGIRALLDLIEEHYAAIVYDWRTRFGLGLNSIVDGTLTWHEAWSLVERLALDPSSHLCASLNGWRHPLTREGMALANLYDVTVAAHTDKRRRRSIKPYPRPWKHARGARSKAPLVDQATVRALLDSRRPQSAEQSTSDDQEEVHHGR